MNKLKYLIVLVIFAGVLIFALLGYRWLSESYVPVHIPPTAGNTEETSETSAESGETATEPQRTGEEVPDFTVYDMSGNAVKLSDFAGKPVVLNFWASWCSPCKAEMPHFDQAAAEYGEDIHFLMVNLTDGYRETEASIAAFIEKNGYTFPVYLDTTMEAAYNFGVTSIPKTYFLWEDGTLMDEYLGTLSESKLNGYIEKLKGEE
ncbi:MAG: TlpA family protein disulfide reductase [Clostridia bacterium]|nr:TlpA family protein disulfide reductase [Clostridia bacterium]